MKKQIFYQKLLLYILSVLIMFNCQCVIVQSYTVVHTTPGYVPRMDIGTQVIIPGSNITIELGTGSQIVEILAGVVPYGGSSATLQILALMQDTSTTPPAHNISFIVLENSNLYESQGLILYTINMTSDDPSEDSYSRVLMLGTSQERLWVDIANTYTNETFYATKPNSTLYKFYIFLGVITYPVMAIWAILLNIASIVYWFVKEKGKKNQAALGELGKKITKNIILLSVGIGICLLGIACTLVVAFFTKRDMQDVCCTYFPRQFNYSGLPPVTYDNNCRQIPPLIHSNEVKSSWENGCFADSYFIINYKANTWWWLLLCGTIPGLLLYTIGYLLITIAAYKLLRLRKKQHVPKVSTKFTVVHTE
jgi:hypothetical protein